MLMKSLKHCLAGLAPNETRPPRRVHICKQLPLGGSPLIGNQCRCCIVVWFVEFPTTETDPHTNMLALKPYHDGHVVLCCLTLKV